MKRVFFILLLLLLLLGAVTGLMELWDPAPVPAPAPVRPQPPVGPPTVEPMPGVGSEDGTGSPTETTEPVPPGGARDSVEGAVNPPDPVEGGTEPVTNEPTAPPAVRRNPRDPPTPDPKVRPMGNRPPLGPTGLWEKFPPAIPRGRAAIEVRVVDSEGLPIPGADVHLGPPDIRGQSAVSYAHLRKLGKTDESGRVKAARLPPGAAAVAGNLTGLLNGPRGLDARSAVAVTLVDDRTVTAEVRLPFSVADFGKLAGIVLGPDGKPLRNAQVFTGYYRVRTKRDGRFEIAALPAGEHRMSITRSGYRAHGETVTVASGETTEVEVALEFRESGSLALAGTVTGPAGEPVPGARVYLIVIGTTSSGTIRSAETDETGRYSMASLPDRLAKSKIRVQGSKMGYHAANEVFEEGLRSPEVNLKLPVKLSRLKLTVVDSATGIPLDRCRFEATKEGEDRPSRTFSSRSETGVYETWIEAGKYSFLIEAPDHESITVDATVPGGGAEFPYSARLVGTKDQSVEVSLIVLVRSATTGEPIETVKVEVLDPVTGESVARFEGRRPGGKVTMPAPSGRRKIRVSADGFETLEMDTDLKASEPEREIEAKLTPR